MSKPESFSTSKSLPSLELIAPVFCQNFIRLCLRNLISLFLPSLFVYLYHISPCVNLFLSLFCLSESIFFKWIFLKQKKNQSLLYPLNKFHPIYNIFWNISTSFDTHINSITPFQEISRNSTILMERKKENLVMRIIIKKRRENFDSK